MNANEVTAFYEGYQSYLLNDYHNRYQNNWGSGEKQAWNNAWEQARRYYALLDRLDIIELDRQTLDDKIQIVMRHSFPETIEDSPFNYNDIIYNKDNIRYIIYKISNNERSSVRDINRAIIRIVKRLNKQKIMENFSFPCKLTRKIIDELLYDTTRNSDTMFSLYS